MANDTDASSGTNSQTTPSSSSGAVIMRVGWPNAIKSSAALAVWMILFSAGLLLDSSPERYILAPMAIEKQIGKEGMESLDAYFRDTRKEAANGKLESSPNAAGSPPLLSQRPRHDQGPKRL